LRDRQTPIGDVDSADLVAEPVTVER
jgi:hypothetical protein